MDINSPITVLRGIGESYKYLIGKLGIGIVEDLLYHFPFRYEDFSKVISISEAREGETVTVNGVMEKIDNIYTRNGKRITRAKISDHTGFLDVYWFNQHYLKNYFKPGQNYTFSGKVGKFSNKLSFVSPEYEPVNGAKLNTGRLVAVYPETVGITSKWLRNKINDVFSFLNFENSLRDYLPEKIILKENLWDLKTSLKQIHFPDSLKDAEKAKNRLAFDELFFELLNVETRKNQNQINYKSFPFDAKKYLTKMDGFIKSLPFKLTASQDISLKEIIDDMAQSHPMSRLLEGDVGTGKTIVAVAATYYTHLNGYKTLYLAPTEILANQHFETFNKFLSPYNVKIGLKTSSNKLTGNKTDFDVLVGTHALLFGEDKFKKIGLVVIDEQHRFGVEQRAKLLLDDDGTKPHLLSMTATPIPRTLALTLYGDLNISILKTHPNTEKKITTKIVSENAREKAYMWINERNEPTFVVCPLIEISESTGLENVKSAEYEFKKLKEGVFSNKTIGLLHGRMKSKDKEEVMKKFRNGEIQILVSTPVIEVGVDIPEATIMVIESAERYGLASLHQLRGRVGRGNKEGFCMLFMSNNSHSAYSRLKNLEVYNSGLDLAEIDMRIRGQGDIYGTMQHGYKTFKIADLSNLTLIEKAKEAAQEIYKELDTYPKLIEKLAKSHGKMVEMN